MKKKLFEITPELESDIINAAYGDADIIIRTRVYFLRKRHSEVNDMYMMYKDTARKVHDIHPEECPDYIVDLALIRITDASTSRKNNFFSFFHLLILKPFVPAITVVALILLLSLNIFKTTDQRSYSDEEIRLADKQARQALMIVGSVFNKTSKKVTDNILADKVADPIYEGISIIDDLLKENRNEKTN